MRQIDWKEAEKIAGRRLDRRRSYATTDDGQPDESGKALFTMAKWTGSCSGCTESEDGHPVGHYPADPKHHCLIGAGCPECGYTGKTRRAYWVPAIEAAKED